MTCKFDVVLEKEQWEQLRPIVKELQKSGNVRYEPMGYYDKLLILFQATEEGNKKINEALLEILGYIYP